MKSDLHGPLADGVKAFLSHKRALGKQLQKPELVLRQLDQYLAQQSVPALGDITPDVINGFVLTRRRRSPRSYNALLSVLRGFFDWLVRNDQLERSPLLVPPRRVTLRRVPFLFNSDQAKMLFAAAAILKDNSYASGRGETYRMAFILLYGLGLRVGEVCRLCRKDVDLGHSVLVIRQTKFGKNRLVPFGPKMGWEIQEYLKRREISGPVEPDYPVFSFANDRRRPVGPKSISWTFHKLVSTLELKIPEGVTPPYLHCLRHSFAVGTLLRWYRAGFDPGARLLSLSTFLGHTSPSSTAVYLTITSELLECASQRFAEFACPTLMEVMP
jgi:integrase/recombinase XerD